MGKNHELGAVIIGEMIVFFADLSGKISMLCLIGCLLMLAGCGGSEPDGHAVAGVVSYLGKPLHLGTVRFFPRQGHPSPPVPIGNDGRFETELPEGEYRVEVKAVEVPAVQNTPGRPQKVGFEGEVINHGPPPRWLIPKKYGRYDTSGLTVSVAAEDMNTIDIQLR